MGWFSEFTDFISGGDGIVGPLIGVGRDIISGLISSDASSDARDATAQSQREVIEFQKEQTAQAIALFEKARDQGLEFLDAGMEAELAQLGVSQATSRAIYQDLIAKTAPGLQFHRQQLGRDPSVLTASQKIGLEDARREVGAFTAANLDLRGSGRAQAAIMDDVVQRYIAGAQTENLNRQERSAGALTPSALSTQATLAASETAAGTQLGDVAATDARNRANLAVGAGTQAGTATQAGAAPVSAAIGNIGKAQATDEIEQGQITTGTIGSLAGIFNDIAKSERQPTEQKLPRKV